MPHSGMDLIPGYLIVLGNHTNKSMLGLKGLLVNGVHLFFLKTIILFYINIFFASTHIQQIQFIQYELKIIQLNFKKLS